MQNNCAKSTRAWGSSNGVRGKSSKGPLDYQHLHGGEAVRWVGLGVRSDSFGGGPEVGDSARQERKPRRLRGHIERSKQRI